MQLILQIQMKSKSYSATRFLHLQKLGFQIETQKPIRQDWNRKKTDEMKHPKKSFSFSKQKIKKIHIYNPIKNGTFHISRLSQNNKLNTIEPTKTVSVSSHKWAIFDFYTAKYIRGYRSNNKSQLGVFSKLLVFCTINTLITKHKIELGKFQTIVTSGELKMFPKQNALKKGDIISLYDLLHLMILDESQLYEVVLCTNVGAYLHKTHNKQHYSVYNVYEESIQGYLKYFYELVNSYCKLMSLEDIKYVESDPRLRKQMNRCSASDVAKLSIQCLNIPLYQSILKKNQHCVQIKYVDQKGHLSSNSFTVQNKCIQHKYIAYLDICRNWQQSQFMSSHCSIRYEDEKKEQVRPVIVVLLQCYSPRDREKDIQQIVQWYLKGQNFLDEQKRVQIIRQKILKTQPTQKPVDVLERKISEKLSLSKNPKYDIVLPKLQNSQSKKIVRRAINVKTQQSM